MLSRPRTSSQKTPLFSSSISQNSHNVDIHIDFKLTPAIRYHSAITSFIVCKMLSKVSSPFLPLPTELRCMVYRYYIDSFEGVYLRPSRQVPENEPVIPAAGLLQVSRQTNLELGPMFYNAVRFQVAVNPGISQSFDKMVDQLSLVQHLSLSCTYSPLTHQYNVRRVGITGIFRSLEKKIAKNLCLLAKHCTSLKTLTIHLLSDKLSFRDDETDGWDVLDHALHLNTALMEAVRGIQDPEEYSRALDGPSIPWVSHVPNLAGQAVNKFKVRDLITVIGFGLDHSYHHFLSGVPAPLWRYRDLLKWPEINLRAHQRAGIDRISKTYSGGRPEDFPFIKAYFFRQEGSKIKTLPDWDYAIEEETPKTSWEAEWVNGEYRRKR